MKKDRAPSSNTKAPDHLHIFAKTIYFREDRSKKVLKELFSSMMQPERQIGCLSLDANLNKCDEISDDTKKSSEAYADNNKDDKGPEATIVKKFSNNISRYADNENMSEENEIQRLSSLMDKLQLTFDGEWLKRHLRLPLKLAIMEIVEKKPYDPVHYLGFWLLNYRKLEEDKQWRLEEKQELDYYRSFIEKPVSKVEEEISDTGEEEEAMRDWNFKHYDSSYPDVKF